MSKPNYIIRPIELNDCEEVRDIWRKAGTIEMNCMNEVMINFDNDGILVAQDKQLGQLLGVCSGVNLSPELAFVGQYGVRPEYRRLGIGSALWEKAMQHIGTDRNIALSGAQNMVDKYKKIGFGVDNGKIVLFYMGKPQFNELCDRIEGISVVPIDDSNIENVIQYDRHICGLERRVFIEQFSKCEDTIASVALNEKQEVVGYAMIGLSIRGPALIEPLYADNRPTAELLLTTLCKAMPIVGEIGLLYIVWNTNQESVGLAVKLSLELKEWDRLLSTKSIVQTLSHKIFCLSSANFYPF